MLRRDEWPGEIHFDAFTLFGIINLFCVGLLIVVVMLVKDEPVLVNEVLHLLDFHLHSPAVLVLTWHFRETTEVDSIQQSSCQFFGNHSDSAILRRDGLSFLFQTKQNSIQYQQQRNELCQEHKHLNCFGIPLKILTFDVFIIKLRHNVDHCHFSYN